MKQSFSRYILIRHFPSQQMSLKYSLPFSNEEVFPSPTEALSRSPAPEVIAEMFEKEAMLE